ncbi:hypothetical protein AB0H71_33300 [Nocardia sp. NPDC050697]|uniref:hypothetical protein n=1 Tax=Nocardia sp. NPDC050697 TaxID=3155158 RepID=UPI0033E878A6
MFTRFAARAMAACVAVAAGAIGTGLGGGAAQADEGIACLWAGVSHPYLSEVVAGGWTFECGWDGLSSHWFRGGRTGAPSTVPNPGAGRAPSGTFSGGALQPGTAYTDYCVGSQLIEGAEDVYEVVWGASGPPFWKAAAPIAQWRFDAGTGPQPSWRSSSLCYDGMLI